MAHLARHFTRSAFLALVAVAGLAASGAPGRAAEVGKIRLGGDYDRIQLRNFRQCEQTCRRDPRCRSWTFIKPRGDSTRGQCRLKHIIGQAFANRCCVSGVKARDDESDTAEVQCAAFASRAVDDYERNLADRCGLRGPLWHGRYKRHFRRCKRLEPAARRDERNARAEALEECRNLAGRSRSMRCEHYARMSIQQQKSNTLNGCGFSGELWRGNRRALERWCEEGTRSADRDRIFKRERMIRRCLSRGGGGIDEACRTIAKSLVALNDRRVRGRCGLRGAVWHNDFQRHYRWCLDNKQRTGATISDMKDRLVRCERRNKKFKFLFRF